jgi:hypothetical protein
MCYLLFYQQIKYVRDEKEKDYDEKESQCSDRC